MSDESPQPVDAPVSPEVAEMARQAARDFRECFRFRHPEAAIGAWEDVELAIDRLLKPSTIRKARVSLSVDPALRVHPLGPRGCWPAARIAGDGD